MRGRDSVVAWAAVSTRSREILRLGRKAGDEEAAQRWLRCIELDDGAEAARGAKPGLPAIRLRPYLFYGEYLMARGKAAEALGYLTWAAAYWPTDPIAQDTLGRCRMDLKDWAGAISALQRSFELLPDANTAVFLAFSLGRLRRYDERKDWLLRAIEVDPRHDEAHYNLGGVYARDGDRDAAIEHLRRAVEIDPDYTIAHALIGEVYLARVLRRRPEDHHHSDWTHALEHLTRAITLDPRDGWSHLRLASLHDAQDRDDETEEHYKAAAQRLPDVAIVWSHYGYFLAKLDDHAEAERMLRLAVSLEPDNEDTRYWLGRYLWNIGDYDAGRAELELADRRGHPTALAWLRHREAA